MQTDAGRRRNEFMNINEMNETVRGIAICQCSHRDSVSSRRRRLQMRACGSHPHQCFHGIFLDKMLQILCFLLVLDWHCPLQRQATVLSLCLTFLLHLSFGLTFQRQDQTRQTMYPIGCSRNFVKRSLL
ncbi:hypothetical protein O6H91_05G007100 [Diphasiastrum complanatum]|uniref:Uncharacterized protein n=1 Tax=Diphasiastrum complanatum TaxID=34168 RepID=A0ACC2DKC7_DIPCM|nr:hypothetical protein O6H91_05G007100 [Diphasiastrum complanatum]